MDLCSPQLASGSGAESWAASRQAPKYSPNNTTRTVHNSTVFNSESFFTQFHLSDTLKLHLWQTKTTTTKLGSSMLFQHSQDIMKQRDTFPCMHNSKRHLSNNEKEDTISTKQSDKNLHRCLFTAFGSIRKLCFGHSALTQEPNSTRNQKMCHFSCRNSYRNSS